MNEQLQQSMSEIIEVIKASKDFATEQLPIVAQEYLALYRWSAVLGLVIAGILLSVSAWLYRLSVRAEKNEDMVGLTLLSLIILVPTLVFGTASTYYLVKVSVAPRVVVLEKLEQMLK